MELPPKEEFYSKLTNSGISDEDYLHAQKVWNNFGMKTMRDYHNLYLTTDVMLLEDVFENFRTVCKNNYGLDPTWYYTSPGLSWDALLKTTKVELELLTDIDMLLMIENGIRGEVSTITKRHAKANNPYMGYTKGGVNDDTLFDKEKPSVFLPYLDANNLYGHAMSMNLPMSDFKWMEDLENWKN